MANKAFAFTKIAGGTAGCLDDLIHTNISDGDMAIVNDAINNRTYTYTYESTSALAESLNNIVKPDSNSGNGRWIRVWDSERTCLIDATVDQGNNAIVGTLAWHIADASGSKTTVTVLPGTYKITINITVPITMQLDIKEGGIFKPDTSKTLTVYSPEHILAGKRQQIIDLTNNSDDPLLFSIGGEVPVNWFATNTTPGTTDMTVPIQLAVNSLPASAGNEGSVILNQGEQYAVLYLAANDRSGYPGDLGADDISCAIVMDNYIKFTGGGTLKLLDDTGHTYWAWSVFGTLTDVKITDFTLDDIGVDASGASGAGDKLIILEEFDKLSVCNCTLKDIALPRLGHSDVATYSSQYHFTGNRLDNTNAMGLFYVQDFVISGNSTLNPISEFVDAQAGCRRFSINSNSIQNDGGDAGIEINAGSDGEIVGNEIYNSSATAEGILINAKAIPPQHGGPTDTGSSHIVISGNSIYSARSGIILADNLDSATAVGIADIIVNDNDIYGNNAASSFGVEIRGGSRIKVLDNNIYKFRTGIGNVTALTNNPLDDIDITNNTIRDCADNGVVARNPKAIKTNYNTIINCGTTGASDDYNGIYWYTVDSGAYDRQLIGNQVDEGHNGIRISGTLTGRTILRNNQITGYDSLPFKLPADMSAIEGETCTQLLYSGTLGAGSDIEIPVLSAINMGLMVTDFYIMAGADVTQHDDDYLRIRLYDKGSDGSSSNVIASGNTVTTGVDINDFDAVQVDSTLDQAHGTLVAGDNLSVDILNVGNGQAIVNPISIVKYITY